MANPDHKKIKKLYLHNDSLRDDDVVERIARMSRPNGAVCGQHYHLLFSYMLFTSNTFLPAQSAPPRH